MRPARVCEGLGRPQSPTDSPGSPGGRESQPPERRRLLQPEDQMGRCRGRGAENRPWSQTPALHLPPPSPLPWQKTLHGCHLDHVLCAVSDVYFVLFLLLCPPLPAVRGAEGVPTLHHSPARCLAQGRGHSSADAALPPAPARPLAHRPGLPNPPARNTGCRGITDAQASVVRAGPGIRLLNKQASR